MSKRIKLEIIDWDFIIHLQLDKWHLWYQEVMRRIKAWEQEVFDVDEAWECGRMSYAHFQEMDKYLFELACQGKFSKK